MSSINDCGTLANLVASPRRAGARPYRAFHSNFQAAAALLLLLLLGAVSHAQAQPLRILAFGDSLTAGLGLPAGDEFPAQLERRLRADGFDVRLINAGVSGDTTMGGLARLDFSLGEGADLVILELGANDMLRGLPPRAARENLGEMIDTIEARGAAVVLAGMSATANFGAAYKAQFDAIYPDLAQERGLPLYPFFLAGVAGDPTLTLPDGLHPNAAGVARIVAGVAPLIEESLKRLAAKPGARMVR
jgi:acyl-CoA thioesterase I